MPFIHVMTDRSISEKTGEQLKASFGEAIAMLPGKSEQWLMVCLEGDKRMWFRGDNEEGCAMVDVAVYGKLDDMGCAMLTSALTETLSTELSLPPGQIYVSYRQTNLWGWGGDLL